ncbi:MAG: cobalamin adenosyltransferase [Planctomycetota bacterium]|jgi:ethanolamine utilization cobalamin adenosyltransferase|nr:cobalamin adenosyltransferase [Planctomycetota bacterium]
MASDPSAAGEGRLPGEKPEHFTHLGDGRLVPKSHPRILWRGAMDVFLSFLLEARIGGERLGDGSFAGEIREIADFSHDLLAREVSGRETGEFVLLGLSGEEIHELGRRTARVFGPGRRRCSPEMGEAAAILNRLRALCRQAETAAVAAFVDGEGRVLRPDLILALNRLSSLLFVLMFRRLPPEFELSPAQGALVAELREGLGGGKPR